MQREAAAVDGRPVPGYATMNVMTDSAPKPLPLSPAAAALKPKAAPVPPGAQPDAAPPVPEQGGPKGPEPTRFGDWERNGRCIDF